MKLFLDKKNIDEITLSYMELNLLINSKNSNIYKYIYDFLINSDLIDNKTKNILTIHSIGEYYKAYEALLIQSDISNPFYDKLSNQLLYIEFLNLIKLIKSTDYSFIQKNSKYINQNDVFLNQIEKNKFYNNNYNNPVNSYFGVNDTTDNDVKEKFFKKRHKVIKFFDINLDKIKNFNIENADLIYISEEINYAYKSLLKLFKVKFYLIIFLFITLYCKN